MSIFELSHKRACARRTSFFRFCGFPDSPTVRGELRLHLLRLDLLRLVLWNTTFSGVAYELDRIRVDLLFELPPHSLSNGHVVLVEKVANALYAGRQERSTSGRVVADRLLLQSACLTPGQPQSSMQGDPLHVTRPITHCFS